MVLLGSTVSLLKRREGSLLQVDASLLWEEENLKDSLHLLVWRILTCVRLLIYYFIKPPSHDNVLKSSDSM